MQKAKFLLFVISNSTYVKLDTFLTNRRTLGVSKITVIRKMLLMRF